MLWFLRYQGRAFVMLIITLLFEWYGNICINLKNHSNSYSTKICSAYRPWNRANLVLSSREKAKPTFLLPLVCLNHRSSEAKISPHSYYLQNAHNFTLERLMMMIMMMMIMTLNCFCGMVDRRKGFSLISSRDHCQRSSRSPISNTPRAGFKPAQNQSLSFVEWSCGVVITTTPRLGFSY